MYYQIKEILTPCTAETIIRRDPDAPPYVVVMDPETWGRTHDKFDQIQKYGPERLYVFGRKIRMILHEQTCCHCQNKSDKDLHG